jgi:ABC transporter substrate binding protein
LRFGRRKTRSPSRACGGTSAAQSRHHRYGWRSRGDRKTFAIRKLDHNTKQVPARPGLSEDRIDHIGRHRVRPEEVEDVCFGDAWVRRAKATAARARANAVMMNVAGPIGLANQKEIAELAVKYQLRVIYTLREYVEAGGLMNYGVSISDLDRRAATYVDKILKGAKPADLPVEQPIKFEFIVNLKAAKQIGLTIPPNALARADRVIR